MTLRLGTVLVAVVMLNCGTSGGGPVGRSADGSEDAVVTHIDAGTTEVGADDAPVIVSLPPVGNATSVQIDSATTAYGKPRVAIDATGSATVVWQQNQTPQGIWTNRYQPMTGWGIARALDQDKSRGSFPEVAVDSAGNALAGWVVSVPGQSSVAHFSRFTSTGWVSQPDISAAATRLRVVGGGQGRSGALLVGQIVGMSGLPPEPIASLRRFDPNASWQQAETIRPTGSAGAQLQTFDVAMGAGGTTVELWSEAVTGRADCDLFFDRHDPIEGWNGASFVDTHQCQALFPRIGVDGQGQSIAVFAKRLTPTSQTQLVARRWDGRSWGSAESLGVLDEGRSNFSAFAVANDGGAVALWHAGEGPILSQHFEATTGWRASRIPGSVLQSGRSIELRAHARGGAIAVWEQVVFGPAPQGGYPHIFYSRYTPSTGWTAARQVDAGVLTATEPDVAANDKGDAVAAWNQGGVSGHIWATHLP